MSNLAVKITESLMLRRIDPVDMLRRYLAGDLIKIEIPKDKISISSSFIDLSQRIGNDSSSRSYRFNDKTNSGQIIVTTNHNEFNSFKDLTEGKLAEGKLPEGRQPEKGKRWCLWSKREITGESIGIPIAMDIDRYTNKITFYVEDTYYNFGCAMAALKRNYLCHRHYKDPLYMDAEQMLHCMYYRLYPEKIGTRIVEAKDWRLLDLNGGPLTEEEYDSDQQSYIGIPNVVIIPIKRQYIKLALPKK